MGLFSGLSKILRGLKSSVESRLLLPFKDRADNLREKSPEFRFFLDSKLGSPIETSTKKIWADAMVGNLREYFPKWKITTAIAIVWGNTIGDKAGRLMDKKKLKDHYKKGWISVDEYSERRATQIHANIINLLKRPIMDTRELMKHLGLKDVLDKVDEFIKPIVDIKKKEIDPIVDTLGEKSKNLMQKGIATFHNGINELKGLGIEINENFVKPVIEKASAIIGKTTSAVIEFGKKTTETVKKGFNKIWKWITGK